MIPLVSEDLLYHYLFVLLSNSYTLTLWSCHEEECTLTSKDSECRVVPVRLKCTCPMHCTLHIGAGPRKSRPPSASSNSESLSAVMSVSKPETYEGKCILNCSGQYRTIQTEPISIQCCWFPESNYRISSSPFLQIEIFSYIGIELGQFDKYTCEMG